MSETSEVKPEVRYLRFTWRSSDLYETLMTPDEVREMFGLGGTPDGELEWKVRMLMENPRHQVYSQTMQQEIRDHGEFTEGGDPGPMAVKTWMK